MAKIYNLLAMCSIATLLATGGFAGFLFGTGRLNAGRIEKLAALLRGELDTPLGAAASQPTSTSAPAAPQRHGASADETRRQMVQEQLHRATLERAASDIAARQGLLNQAMQSLIKTQEDFEKSKAAWLAQQRKLSDAARDEGFKRELQYVEKLNPKLAKEHVLRTWKEQKADAVRLFAALAPAKGQRILEQFTSPDEINIMHELLEQLRLSGADQFTDGSGKTAAKPKP